MRYCITGITGTLGHALTRHLLADPRTERIVGISRNEHRQVEMERVIADPRFEAWIGDVRDRDCLHWVFRAGFDAVIHGAALKRIETCEEHPDEAYKTNVLGTWHVVEAAMLADVPKVLVVSSDKSAEPALSYGRTKAAAEDLALGQNAKRGKGRTRISVARYGNVIGSTGSVIEQFFRCRATGESLRITDPTWTRFWWSPEEAAAFVDSVLARMQGAEIWVPRLVSATVLALAQAIAPRSAVQVIGARGVEKPHETMIGVLEAGYTWALPDAYVLLPKHGQWWSPDPPAGAVKVPEGFRFSSDQDPQPVTFVPDGEFACVS